MGSEKKELALVCRKLVHRYELLIKTADTTLFDGYGSYSSCLLCRHFNVSIINLDGCSKCPLGGQSRAGCVSMDGRPTRDKMIGIITGGYGDRPAYVRMVARERLEWLKSMFSKAGVGDS